MALRFPWILCPAGAVQPWTSGEGSNDSPRHPPRNCDGKPEPSTPEWGCHSCRRHSVGVGWGMLGEGLLHYACFFPKTALHGEYATEFDQNLRLRVPCYPADSWTEVNQRASVQGGSLYYSCCLKMMGRSFVLCPSVPSGPRQGCVSK